jgi:hypothetical protein
VDLALAEVELSLRELAVRLTERDGYFVSGASVSRNSRSSSRHLAEPGLEPLASEFLAVGRTGYQVRLAGSEEGIAPATQRRRRDMERA